jgi:hypothetical protein
VAAGALFPDLSSAMVLAAFRVESFTMKFPVARVEDVVGKT